MIKSFKTRLLILATGVFFGTLLLIEIIVYFALDSYLYSRVDSRLQVEARELSAIMRWDDNVVSLVDSSEWREMEHTEGGDQAIYMLISDSSGAILAATPNMSYMNREIPMPAHIPEKLQIFTQAIDSLKFRRVQIPVSIVNSNKKVALSALTNVNSLVEFMDSMRLAFFVLTPFFLLFALAGVAFLSRRIFDPIQKITDTAHYIMQSGKLDTRIEAKNTDKEIGVLIDTLNALFARLKDSLERIKNFSSHASHELRTPLTVMRGQIDVTLQREREPYAYKETLASLSDESRKMTQIVENLLQLARLEAGKNVLEKQIINFEAFCQELEPEIRAKVESAGLQFESECQGFAEIVANKSALRLLFKNLVDNAIKFNKPGGAVHVCARVVDDKITISVRDTGVGMTEEIQSQIFEPFYRSSKAESEGISGSGLGLTIVQQIVREHEAEISVQSAVDEGTEFVIQIPVVEYDE